MHTPCFLPPSPPPPPPPTPPPQVHSLVDADAGLPPTYHGSRGRLDPLRKKVAVCGLILFGTLISTLGKLGRALTSSVGFRTPCD